MGGNQLESQAIKNAAAEVARSGEGINAFLQELTSERQSSTDANFDANVNAYLEEQGLLPTLSLVYAEEVALPSDPTPEDQMLTESDIEELIQSNEDPVTEQFLIYLRDQYDLIRLANLNDGQNGNADGITIQDIHAWTGDGSAELTYPHIVRNEAGDIVHITYEDHTADFTYTDGVLSSVSYTENGVTRTIQIDPLNTTSHFDPITGELTITSNDPNVAYFQDFMEGGTTFGSAAADNATPLPEGTIYVFDVNDGTSTLILPDGTETHFDSQGLVFGVHSETVTLPNGTTETFIYGNGNEIVGITITPLDGPSTTISTLNADVEIERDANGNPTGIVTVTYNTYNESGQEVPVETATINGTTNQILYEPVGGEPELRDLAVEGAPTVVEDFEVPNSSLTYDYETDENGRSITALTVTGPDGTVARNFVVGQDGVTGIIMDQRTGDYYITYANGSSFNYKAAFDSGEFVDTETGQIVVTLSDGSFWMAGDADGVTYWPLTDAEGNPTGQWMASDPRIQPGGEAVLTPQVAMDGSITLVSPLTGESVVFSAVSPGTTETTYYPSGLVSEIRPSGRNDVVIRYDYASDQPEAGAEPDSLTLVVDGIERTIPLNSAERPISSYEVDPFTGDVTLTYADGEVITFDADSETFTTSENGIETTSNLSGDVLAVTDLGTTPPVTRTFNYEGETLTGITDFDGTTYELQEGGTWLVTPPADSGRSQFTANAITADGDSAMLTLQLDAGGTAMTFDESGLSHQTVIDTTVVESVEHDAEGNLIATILEDGTRQEFNYGSNGEIVSITVTSPEGTVTTVSTLNADVIVERGDNNNPTGVVSIVRTSTGETVVINPTEIVYSDGTTQSISQASQPVATDFSIAGGTMSYHIEGDAHGNSITSLTVQPGADGTARSFVVGQDGVTAIILDRQSGEFIVEYANGASYAFSPESGGKLVNPATGVAIETNAAGVITQITDAQGVVYQPTADGTQWVATLPSGHSFNLNSVDNGDGTVTLVSPISSEQFGFDNEGNITGEPALPSVISSDEPDHAWLEITYPDAQQTVETINFDSNDMPTSISVEIDGQTLAFDLTGATIEHDRSNGSFTIDYGNGHTVHYDSVNGVVTETMNDGTTTIVSYPLEDRIVVTDADLPGGSMEYVFSYDTGQLVTVIDGFGTRYRRSDGSSLTSDDDSWWMYPANGAEPTIAVGITFAYENGSLIMTTANDGTFTLGADGTGASEFFANLPSASVDEVFHSDSDASADYDLIMSEEYEMAPLESGIDVVPADTAVLPSEDARSINWRENSSIDYYARQRLLALYGPNHEITQDELVREYYRILRLSLVGPDGRIGGGDDVIPAGMDPLEWEAAVAALDFIIQSPETPSWTGTFSSPDGTQFSIYPFLIGETPLFSQAELERFPQAGVAQEGDAAAADAMITELATPSFEMLEVRRAIFQYDGEGNYTVVDRARIEEIMNDPSYGWTVEQLAVLQYLADEANYNAVFANGGDMESLFAQSLGDSTVSTTAQVWVPGDTWQSFAIRSWQARNRTEDIPSDEVIQAEIDYIQSQNAARYPNGFISLANGDALIVSSEPDTVDVPENGYDADDYGEDTADYVVPSYYSEADYHSQPLVTS